MCGRFFVDAKNRKIDRLLEMLPDDSLPVKTGEIYPTDNALVLVDDGPRAMSWGFPHYDGKGVVFNARAETAQSKPMFAQSLKRRPAAIPTSGFYEWQAKECRKAKYLFTAKDAPILYLAGFWNNFGPQSGQNPNRFTILTTVANPSMRPYHSRMPVLLAQSEIPSWLSGQNLADILAREPFALDASLCEKANIPANGSLLKDLA